VRTPSLRAYAKKIGKTDDVSAFLEMLPHKYYEENNLHGLLIEQIKALNREIMSDASLGPGFRIGHSYFCVNDPSACTTDWMRSVVEFDILPTLTEYWFDAPEKLHRWEENLRGVFNDD